LSQPVLTRAQWVRLIFMGLLIAVGTLAIEATYEPVNPTVAATMGFVVFGLFNVAFGLSARSETGSILTRDTVADRRQMGLYGLAVLMIFLPTELNFGQRILKLTPLTGDQWLVCIVTPLILLIVDEVIKYFMRRRRSQNAPAAQEPQPA
jgi:Ca2+-transporting ATPase